MAAGGDGGGSGGGKVNQRKVKVRANKVVCRHTSSPHLVVFSEVSLPHCFMGLAGVQATSGAQDEAFTGTDLWVPQSWGVPFAHFHSIGIVKPSDDRLKW